MIPRFSIIVPVYKTEAYLRQCVDSVLEQSFTDLEVILVDDGSPDGSGAICDQYAQKDSRVKVIHKENGGVTAARTVGAQAATGDYVLLLDSDDYYDTGLLAQLNHILQTHQPDAILFDGVTFDTSTPQSFSTALPEGLYHENVDKLRDGLILDGQDRGVISYGVSAKVFRREAYVAVQAAVPACLWKGEDMAVSVPLLARCERVYVSHICGYFYRDTPGSIMNSFCEEEAEQIRLVAEQLRKSLPHTYERRIDSYVVTHLFDYLDRAMIGRSFGAYMRLARAQLGDGFLPVLRRARSQSPRLRERLVFLLTAHRCFALLWLLRKLKPRK